MFGKEPESGTCMWPLIFKIAWGIDIFCWLQFMKLSDCVRSRGKEIGLTNNVKKGGNWRINHRNWTFQVILPQRLYLRQLLYWCLNLLLQLHKIRDPFCQRPEIKRVKIMVYRFVFNVRLTLLCRFEQHFEWQDCGTEVFERSNFKQRVNSKWSEFGLFEVVLTFL